MPLCLLLLRGRQPLFQTGPVSPTLLGSLISFSFCALPSQEDTPPQTNNNNRERERKTVEARSLQGPPILSFHP